MKLEIGEIVENRQITSDLWDVMLRAPQIAREAKPGQFLHVRVSNGVDPLLRRPMSFYRIGSDTVDLLVRDAGRGSKAIIGKGVGDTLDLMGPLGNGFSIHPTSRHLLMIGGGSGVGPLVALSEVAVSQGLSVVMLLGFRSADRVYPSELLSPEVEYYVATDDGSAGYHGFVTDLVSDYLGWADSLYGCGPRAMFLSLLKVARGVNLQKSVQLSMEENMACGVGACFGCVVENRRGEMKSVCQDGPVFEMRDLVWG